MFGGCEAAMSLCGLRRPASLSPHRRSSPSWRELRADGAKAGGGGLCPRRLSPGGSDGAALAHFRVQAQSS